MSTLPARAEEFARQADAGRRLPGEHDLWQPPGACVAEILRHIGASDELIAAGYLSSLTGSTSVTAQEVEREFGAAISALVRSVAGARRTHAIGAGRLVFEDADVQTLVLAADLATLRGAHEMTPEVRASVLDHISVRAARLLSAHLYLQYEVRHALARWQDAPSHFESTAGVSKRAAMKSIVEFESSLRALIGTDPEARPFICEGSPLSCRVIVVGSDAPGAVPFWPFWRSRVGFDKRAWDAEYLRANRVYSPAGRRLLGLRRALGPEAQPLESSVHARPSSVTLSGCADHPRTEVLEFLLEAVRPEVGFFHGNAAAALGARMARRFGFRLLTGKPVGLWSQEAVAALAREIHACLGMSAEPAGPSGDPSTRPAALPDQTPTRCA